MPVVVHTKFDELADPKSLLDSPKNRNKHGQDQIERLALLYEEHGIRVPIIISKRSGFIVSGHCRKLAAILAGIERVPVVYQDFSSDEHEYAFAVSENAIASWAELDLAGINADLPDLGPQLDIDSLGIKNFTLDFQERCVSGGLDSVETKSHEDKEGRTTKRCPHCGLDLD